MPAFIPPVVGGYGADPCNFVVYDCKNHCVVLRSVNFFDRYVDLRLPDIHFSKYKTGVLTADLHKIL